MSNASVSVVVPWRPSPGRERHLNLVRIALTAALPGAEVAAFDTGHQPFNRAAARNGGVRNSYGGANVLVVCDADTVVDRESLRMAVKGAHDGRLHLPYTTCRMLSPKGTEAALTGGGNVGIAEAEASYNNSIGGCVVVAYDTWREVGGWDERFTHWGFEDVAFWCAVDTFYGTVRHPGTIHHLWHPDGRGLGSPEYQTGLALCQRYTDARGNPEAIRAILEERACASA